MKIFTGISALVLACALAVPAAAQDADAPSFGPGMGRGMGMHRGMGMGPGMGMRPGMGPGMMGKKQGMHDKFLHKAHIILMNAEKLELTEEQEQAIFKLMMDTKKTVIRGKADLEVIMVDVESAMHERKPDQKALYSLIDKKYETKKALAKKVVDACLTLKETLSDSQYKTLKKMLHKKAGQKGKAKRRKP
ncbi:MAG: hypothetical protein ABIJ96_12895 [Elusimicrobiota bacterium]